MALQNLALKFVQKLQHYLMSQLTKLYYDDLSIHLQKLKLVRSKSLADVIDLFESWLEIIEDPARRNLVRIALLIPANQIENAIKFLTELPTP